MKWSTVRDRVTPVASRAPWTLKAYRLLTALALPFANTILDRRLKRGKELAARLPERIERIEDAQRSSTGLTPKLSERETGTLDRA